MLTRIKALAVADPTAARYEILRNLGAVEGVRAQAAERLGVSSRTLLRLIESLGIWDQVDELCASNGWVRAPGTPRKGA